MPHLAITWPLAGLAAGMVTGLFGGGGGLILVTLFLRWLGLEEKRAFASSVAVIFPICLLSVAASWFRGSLDLAAALPYLAGGLAGGWLGGRLFSSASPLFLRRCFAVFLIYGGLRWIL